VTKIYVDGDACPVKQEVMKVAARLKLEVYLVSNQWLRLPVGPGVHKQVVPEGADAADDWIVENIVPGDLAITSDIPLASRCIEKGAEALGPSGKPFTRENIGMALAMRELKSHLRETGEDRGFNPSFSARDRSNFLNVIDRILVRLIKNPPQT
jgi:uncharacterized protein YaiI (UPF0178 family)